MAGHHVPRRSLVATMLIGLLGLLALVVVAVSQGVIPLPSVLAVVGGLPVVGILVVALHGVVPLALIHVWRRRRHRAKGGR